MRTHLSSIHLLCAIFFGILGVAGSQDLRGQDFAVKTNALIWATTSPNLSVEWASSQKISWDVLGAFNPWTFSDDRKMRFWAVQPGARYWLCQRFEGHFFGAHAHGGQYYGGFHKWRYDGYFVGGGISYGYAWILSPHWNLEAEVGVGYAYLWYKKSPRIPCIKCQDKEHKNYIGPTKASLSIVYVF
ncbi:MAG: DUF3575 domain-containing protein [Bacteroidales bacterium]|nr:DUF3575 domain-containing protein [Bacteroidales bacterium]